MTVTAEGNLCQKSAATLLLEQLASMHPEGSNAADGERRAPPRHSPPISDAASSFSGGAQRRNRSMTASMLSAGRPYAIPTSPPLGSMLQPSDHDLDIWSSFPSLQHPQSKLFRSQSAATGRSRSLATHNRSERKMFPDAQDQLSAWLPTHHNGSPWDDLDFRQPHQETASAASASYGMPMNMSVDTSTVLPAATYGSSAPPSSAPTAMFTWQASMPAFVPSQLLQQPAARMMKKMPTCVQGYPSTMFMPPSLDGLNTPTGRSRRNTIDQSALQRARVALERSTQIIAERQGSRNKPTSQGEEKMAEVPERQERLEVPSSGTPSQSAGDGDALELGLDLDSFRGISEKSLRSQLFPDSLIRDAFSRHRENAGAMEEVFHTDGSLSDEWQDEVLSVVGETVQDAGLTLSTDFGRASCAGADQFSPFGDVKVAGSIAADDIPSNEDKSKSIKREVTEDELETNDNTHPATARSVEGASLPKRIPKKQLEKLSEEERQAYEQAKA